MNAIWKTVGGFPYEVSSLGDVRNSRNGRMLKPRKHTHGYARVFLCSVKNKKEVYVHRIVCRAFHGEADTPSMEVDHINKVRSDNRAQNLRWVTAAENKSQRTFNKGSKHANAKLTDAIAVRILRTNAPAMDHLFAKQFNVSRETIRDVRLGKTWRHVNV